ncbi:MAG: 3-methyl-2-oxobutanoate hydroxymethyltransferase [Candidatus Hodarchaeota archaeon]
MIHLRTSILDVLGAKEAGRKLCMLTAYDSTMAAIIDGVGIDIILVGDSASNVMLGYHNTLPITMDLMVNFTAAVTRSTKNAFIIGDMPFMSYEVNVEEAVRNAGRFIKEGGAMAVKLEGGRGMVDKVKAIVNAGIPVCGHLGLTPQSIHKFGGHKVQGRTAAAARRLIDDAVILQDAGIFLLVLEGIPWQVAKLATEHVSIPTIGIGAGPYCDGQVLVTQDLLGMYEAFKPKFVKHFGKIRHHMTEALEKYKHEVLKGSFPDFEHSYEMPEDELQKLREETSSYAFFYEAESKTPHTAAKRTADAKNGK